MKLEMDATIAAKYKSPSQRARVVTEAWVTRFIYCPNCGRPDLFKYEANRPVADFLCGDCREDYELKSKKKAIEGKVLNGEYETMIDRLTGGDNPNLFLLAYDAARFHVIHFLVIPKYFFVPSIIEKRKPLAPTARRAGWEGCNILINNVPNTGKIYFVRNERVEPKEKVLTDWKKTLFLGEENEVIARGWLLDTMRCVENLRKSTFTIDDAYAFETELSQLHPNNKHIKAKIRQQLQILRDKGYLDFLGRGSYRIR